MASSSDKELKSRLDKLECHKKWQPEMGGSRKGAVNLEKLEGLLCSDIDDFPITDVETYSLLSYLYTLPFGEDCGDLDKAMEYAKHAVEEANRDKSVRDKSLVARANMAHILFELRHIQECQEYVDQLEKDWQNVTPMSKAFVIGSHAYALSKFGPNEGTSPDGMEKKYKLSLGKYQEACRLDPSYPLYHFMKAKIMGRLRRLQKHFPPPDAEEIEELKVANENTQYKHPVMLIRYSLSLVDAKRPEEEHSWLAMEAKKLGSTNVTALTLCATYYKKCHLKAEQKDCLDMLIQMEGKKYKFKSFHKAGRFYWKVQKYMDLDKARLYLKRCVEDAPEKVYFWGEMSWVNFRIQVDNLDPMADFQRMLKKYSGPTNQANVYFEIAKYFWRKNDLDQDREYLKRSLTTDPNCQTPTGDPRSDGRVKSLLKLADESTVEGMLLKAFTLKTMRPPDLILAKSTYEVVLKLQDTNVEALIGLWEVQLSLGNVEESIEVITKLPADTDNHSKFLAQSKLCQARNMSDDEQPNKAMSLYLECVQMGCQDACKPALNLLLRVKPGPCSIQHLYEGYADIQHCYESETSFCLETTEVDGPAAEYDITMIVKQLKLDEVPALRSLRSQRWDMTKKWRHLQLIDGDPGEDVENSIRGVLTLSRYCLDHCIHDVHRKYFFKCKCVAAMDSSKHCSCKSSAHYPYKFGNEDELNKKLCARGLQNFKDVQRGKFAALFDFMWKTSSTYDETQYGWVPEWCEMVNKHKHNTVLPMDNTSDMYSLANKAADYAEMIVSKFNEYLY